MRPVLAVIVKILLPSYVVKNRFPATSIAKTFVQESKVAAVAAMPYTVGNADLYGDFSFDPATVLKIPDDAIAVGIMVGPDVGIAAVGSCA